MKNPLILITNDDGFGAKGLKTIIEVARRYGRVVAVAPELHQSGKSHSITMHNPLYLRTLQVEKDLEIYACSGTPVDCVKLAFDHLLADRVPDITISGINHGSNSAISVLYSGTMGAAIEASFYGRPAIGFSLMDHDPDADFTAAAAIADKILKRIMSGEIKSPMCLNVNIPVLPLEEIRGIRVCRQNEGYWKETFVCRKDPRGKDYFWLTGNFFNAEPDSTDTDEWALANGYASIVPVQVDLTNHRQVTELGTIFRDFE